MRTASLLVPILLSLFSFSGQSVSQEILRQILVAQDSRDVATLRRFLQDSSAAARARAAFAAGSVQDTSLVSGLEELLDDADVGVRRACAFALGQLNYIIDSLKRREIAAQLLLHLKHENNELVTLRMIEALGKMGDAASLSGLLLQAKNDISRELRGEIALSIGRYAYRGIKSAEAASYAIHALETGAGWKATYALFRIGDKNLLAQYTQQIIKAASDEDPNVRMYVATVLGKILPPFDDPEPILTLAASDSDWRVRVNAVKSLSSFSMSDSSRIRDVVLNAINDSNEHVSLSALSAIGTMSGKLAIDDHILEILQQVVSNEHGYSVRQQREAAIAFARLNGKGAFEFLSQSRKNGKLSISMCVEALGNIPSDEALQVLINEVRTENPLMQRLVLEAMLNSLKLSPPARERVSALRLSFMDALSSNDIAVVATAAEALSDSLFASPLCVPGLLDALERRRGSPDVEPLVAVIRSLGTIKDKRAVSELEGLLRDSDYTVALEAASALEEITGGSYRQTIVRPQVPSHTDYDWDLLDQVKKHPMVTVRTARGVVAIEMLPEDAPFTCINFASLIRKGFFNGLTFHRVAPNFVIQGGDPRGDGWGGPGYSIRSELGYEHYERGAVGVASSGKDTEGSQFFVTHSNQPHLDGRYTIFARVIAGMEVVDRIQVGDTIETMTLTDSDGPPSGH